MIPRLGERLKIERKKSGLSQKVIADRIGTTPNNLSKYESGANTPPAEMLYKLAGIYHVSVDYLMGIDNENTFVARGLTAKEMEIFRLILEHFEDLRKQEK